jgi:Na+/melibiose symporter-like transporter
LGVYFNFYFWGFSTAQTSILAASTLLAVLAAMLIAPVISSRLGKRNACITMAVLSVMIGNIPYLLKLAGWMPPTGSPALLGVIFCTYCATVALGLTALILFSSMIADVVEDSQLSTGRRSEGLFFAASSFIQKAVSGIGVFLSSLLLAAVHFPTHARPGAVDPVVLRNLVLIYVPIQAVLYLITMLLLARYRIDRDSHRANLERLSEAVMAVDAIEGGDGAAFPLH